MGYTPLPFLHSLTKDKKIKDIPHQSVSFIDTTSIIKRETTSKRDNSWSDQSFSKNSKYFLILIRVNRKTHHCHWLQSCHKIFI